MKTIWNVLDLRQHFPPAGQSYVECTWFETTLSVRMAL